METALERQTIAEFITTDLEKCSDGEVVAALRRLNLCAAAEGFPYELAEYDQALTCELSRRTHIQERPPFIVRAARICVRTFFYQN